MTDVEWLIRNSIRLYNAKHPLAPCGLCHFYQDRPEHRLGCLAGIVA